MHLFLHFQMTLMISRSPRGHITSIPASGMTLTLIHFLQALVSPALLTCLVDLTTLILTLSMSQSIPSNHPKRWKTCLRMLTLLTNPAMTTRMKMITLLSWRITTRTNLPKTRRNLLNRKSDSISFQSTSSIIVHSV